MKLFFAMFLFICISAAASGQSEGAKPSKQVKQPFSLTISAKPVVKAGSPVHVTVRLTNTSNHDMNGSIDSQLGVNYGYLYEVRDRSGQLIEQKKHDWSHQSSGEYIMLKPGESRDDGTLVSAAYDLSHPGKYSIQLSLPVSNDDGAELVKSNVITVTVEP